MANDSVFDPTPEEKIQRLEEMIEAINSKLEDKFSSNRDSSNVAPTGEREAKDWSYYKDLRKKHPNQYYQPKTQRQLLADVNTLGDSRFWGRGNK